MTKLNLSKCLTALAFAAALTLGRAPSAEGAHVVPQPPVPCFWVRQDLIDPALNTKTAPRTARPVRVESAENLKGLTKLEKKAVRNYLKFVSADEWPAGGLEVSSQKYMKVNPPGQRPTPTGTFVRVNAVIEASTKTEALATLETLATFDYDRKSRLLFYAVGPQNLNVNYVCEGY